MWRALEPGELLPVDTVVRCISQRGRVTSSDLVKSASGDMVPEHTVRFTHRNKGERGKEDWVPVLKPVEHTVHHTFLTVER